MTQTIANVLTGVATLSIRQPNDAIAEWSTEQVHDGETYSVKLTKVNNPGVGGGSTHFQITPVGVTLTNWNDDMGVADTYEYWYRHVAGHPDALVNFEQIEFRFEDPDSDAFVEVTALPFQNKEGDDVWDEYDFQTAPALTGYYGRNEAGTAISGWGEGLTTATTRDHIGSACVGAAVGEADNWICTRIRFELYEDTQDRSMYLGNIKIHSIEYTVEPGGTAPAMSLGSPFTDIGYTEDGVTITYTADTNDIEVEEETFPIDEALIKETAEVTCNMAESSLANIANAMAGAVLSGNILTLGAGTLKTLNLRIEGTNPAGYLRQIFIPKASATGAVGMSYKKGEKTVVPVTFRAIKATGSAAVTIVDNAA